jgi:hypothetical protein
MAQCGHRLAARVLFIRPAGTGADWEETDLCGSARAIPGVYVDMDGDGREAQRFAAETSGNVVLYSADGRLLFHGGITAARGHAGDNLGQGAVVALVNAGASTVDRTCVFGCLLCDKSEGHGDD